MVVLALAFLPCLVMSAEPLAYACASGGGEMVLDENQPITRIGRLPDSDIVVRAARCSRQHGRIERRLDRFVFIDQSTNGSFVTFDKQAEVFVHRKEMLLFGRGQISCGSPASRMGAEVLRFQTLGLTD